MKKRFWEIDAIRGFAIINMIIFNYVFVLNFLGLIDFEFEISYAVLIAGTFIFISGLSQTLSYTMDKYDFKNFTKKGLELLLWGLLITIVTFFMFPEAFIVFGILHFIGASLILGQFFVRFEKTNLTLGILSILLGVLLLGMNVDFPWLIWLGLTPKSFYTFDYFPLFPWFGLTLLGMATGSMYYPKGNRSFKMPKNSENFLIKALCFLGRNSLKIYLLHQPMLAIILFIAGLV